MRGAARHPMTRPLALAGVLVLLISLHACQRGPQEVSLATLADKQDDYRGVTVTTTGVVTRIGEAGDLHYVLEDEKQNRVELLPGTSAADWVGEAVVVTGRFDFKETRGRVLTIETIGPARP